MFSNNPFVFSPKSNFPDMLSKTGFFKEISGSQNLKWVNNLGEKKKMLKELLRREKN